MSKAPSGLIDFACAIASDEPLTWEKTIEGQDVNKWKKTSNGKYRTWMKNETQDLSKLPKGGK